MNTEKLNPLREWRIDFSICTLVTNRSEYARMKNSFIQGGFDDRCEYLIADNVEKNIFDGYSATKRFISEANGRYVIICHQDILLLEAGRSELMLALEKLERKDPSWAVAGNAGGYRPGKIALRLSEPGKPNLSEGAPFPRKVFSLDENFLIVKKESGVSTSNDLFGFHLYGTELCLVAKMLGYSCYVIDFHVLHMCGASKKKNQTDERTRSFAFDYHLSRKRFLRKYGENSKGRWVQDTGGLMFISGSYFLSFLMNRKIMKSISKKISATIEYCCAE